jgi:hypothetical protein
MILYQIKRRKYMKNKIIVYEDYAEIVLYNKYGKEKGREKGRTKVDIDKLFIINNYKWYLNTTGYVCSTLNNKTIILSRLLLSLMDNDELVADHINGDTLDNRMSNLRAVTRQQNAMNHKKHKTNTVGVSGVYWEKQQKKWRVRIVANNKRFHIGYYKNLEEAIEARLEAEKKYYGEYRRIKNEQLQFDFLEFEKLDFLTTDSAPI